MTIIEWIGLGASIIAFVLSITFIIIVLVKTMREGFTRKRTANFILALGLLFIVYLAMNIREIRPADMLQLMLMTGLVAITGVYALFTGRQADASVKMAEEMRAQRVMASRPIIIQKAIRADYFSHFEVYNAGSGPAIEIETTLLNKDKDSIESHRASFLRASDSIEFSPSALASLGESSFYVVSEYQGILSRGSQQTWYQTWLPFKSVKSSREGNIYVNAGELEFKEVFDRERIDAFRSRSKPK